jgi:hypothetical protein
VIETTLIERQDDELKRAIRQNAEEFAMELPAGWDKSLGDMVLRLFRQERAKMKAKQWYTQRMLLTPRLFMSLAQTVAEVRQMPPHLKIMDVLCWPTLADDAKVPFYFHNQPLPITKE